MNFPHLSLSLPFFCVQHQCLQGAVCPVAAASTAYCGLCDLDPSTSSCTWVLSAHRDKPSTTYSPFRNTTHETLRRDPSANTSGSDNTYKMADTYSHTHTEKLPSEGSLCPSHEDVVYSGDANRYTFTGNLYVKIEHALTDQTSLFCLNFF